MPDYIKLNLSDTTNFFDYDSVINNKSTKKEIFSFEGNRD